MSDTEGTGTEEDEQVDTELVFVCKKCNGKQFKTVQDRDAHREWHRLRRENKPGPASKRRSGRVPSPVPSVAGTLFSIHNVPKPKRKKKAPKATDTSAKARKARATAKHIKDSPAYNKRYNGA